MLRRLALFLVGFIFVSIAQGQHAGSDAFGPNNIETQDFSTHIFLSPPAPEDTIRYNTPLSFCEGGSVLLIANGAPPGSTFQWLLNNGNIPSANSGNYIATQSGSYSVIVTSIEGVVTYDAVTVTVFPRPIPDFLFSNDNTCSDTPIQFTSTITSGTAPFTYEWDFGDGNTSQLANPVHSFLSLGCATVTFSVTLVVTDSKGCTNTISKTITVKQKPDVQVADADIFYPFSNCENDPTPGNSNFTITINNTSPGIACIISYSINWGDGNVQNNVVFPVSHTYSQLGAFQMVVTALGSNGCSNSKTYTIANQANPAGGLGTLGATTGLCAPAQVPFIISNWQNNSPGTTYLLDFGDGNSITLTHPLNNELVPDTVYHTYTTSSCPSPTYIASLTVINACDETPYTAGNIQIRIKPKAEFTVPETVCLNTSVCFDNISVAGTFGPDCLAVTQFTWNFGDGTPPSSTESPCHIYTTPGTYTVTLTATNPCGTTTFTREICVVAPLTPAFTINNTTGCAPLSVTCTNTTSLAGCKPPVFNWTVSYSPTNCGTGSAWSFTNGTNASSVNPSFSFTNAGTYIITLAATNACGTFYTNRTVVVKSPPTVTIPAIPNSCGPVTITPSAAVVNCGTGTLTFAWIFAGGNPSTSSSSTPGPVTFSSPGLHSITLAVTNECGTTTTSQEFTINPIPPISVPGPLAFCPGITSPSISVAGNLPGTSYSWVNNNPSIGLAASGAGSTIPAFVTSNTGISPVTATITVTATAMGCTNTSSFTITVNPTPILPIVVSPVNYCKGATATALSGTPTAGHTLNWYTTATGGSPSSTAPTPSTTTEGVTIYYVSQTNVITGCEGPRSAITVNVNPTPVISSFTSINPANCNTGTGSISLNGLNPNTTYTVSYIKNSSTVNVTLVSNSSGTILISGLSAGTYTAIKVILNNCPSNEVGPVVLTDPNPPPQPTVTSNSPVCQGGTLNLNASSSAPGIITYLWSGPGGFSSAEQNPQITGVLLSNSGTYSVTATVNSCSSTSTVNVNVNPKPAKPVVVRPILYCLNAVATPLSATSLPGNQLTWYDNSALNNGSPTAPVPSTNSAGTTEYYVTQSTSFGCESDTSAIQVVVYPAIGGNQIGRDTILCSGNAPLPLTGVNNLTGGNGAFTFQWQFSINSGTDWNDIAGAVNSSYSPGSLFATTYYKRVVSTGPCVNNISNVVIVTVQGTLSNYGISADQVICANTQPAELNGLAPMGGSGSFTFLWQSSSDNINWSDILTATSQDFQPPVLLSTTYYRRKVMSGACSAFSASVEIKVNPVPVINVIPDIILCNNTSINPIVIGSVPQDNTSFTWTNNNTSIGLAGSGTGNIPSFITTNNTNPQAPLTSLITIIPTYTLNAVSCIGNTEDFVITVLPALNIAPIPDIVVCTGTTIDALVPQVSALTPNGASVTFNWTVTGTGITLPSTGSGSQIPSFTTINNGITDLVATINVIPVYSLNGRSCEGEMESYMVTVKSATPDADAGPDVVLCAANAYTMQATSNALTTGMWTQLNGPAIVINDPTLPNAQINGMTVGNVYEFIWTVTGFATCPSTKDTVKIEVTTPLVNSINTGTQTICLGQSVTISGSTPTGGTGLYVYSWEWSTDQISWSTLAGQNSASLTFSPVQSVYVRRIVSSLPCFAQSQPAQVIVQPAISNNIISADQSICINNSGQLIQGSAPTGANGVFTFQWQESVDGGNTWSDIPGATGVDYSPGIMVFTKVYRRIVSSNLCTGPQSNTSNTVTIIVRPDAEALFIPVIDTSCAPFNITPQVIGLQQFPDRNSLYQWYADNISIGTGVNFPGYTINNSGSNVQIKLVVTSMFGCLSDSMTHTFYTPIEPVPEFQLSVAEGCGPLEVSFTNTTPDINVFTYHWDFNNGQTSTLAQPGSITFAPNPTFGDTTYLVTLSAISDCRVITITHPVKVKSKPKALFAPSISVGCSPMTVTFNNTSLGIGNSYLWDFGDGSLPVTSSIIEPVTHIFYSGIQDTFYVKLVALNECGTDTLRYAIVISPNQINLDYAINGNQFSGCSPHTVQFINNSSGANLFTWNFGDNNIINTTENIDTVLHTYFVPGTYTVTLFATNGCSDTTSTETIIVYPIPEANFSSSTNMSCIGLPVQFTNNSSGATSYLWDFGDNTTSTLTNPVHTYSQAGTYSVRLIAFSFNAPGTVCTDTVTQLVQVVTTLPGDFTSSGLNGTCAPFTVSFTNLNTPSVSALWDFGDGQMATGDNVSHTFTVAGTYQVMLTVVVPGGCRYVSMKTVTVLGPSGSWTHTVGYLCGDKAASFQVISQNADLIIYHFGDGSSLSTIESNVFHVYSNPGIYYPHVILRNNEGCLVTLPGLDSIRVDKINAGFLVTQQNNCGNTIVAFQDTSHVFFGKAEVKWNFGDGSEGIGMNPIHEYTASGIYPVQMIVIGNSGCSDTISKQVNVHVNNIPVAEIVAVAEVCSRYEVTFGSTVTSTDEITLIKWTLSNGATGTQPGFNYTFGQAGDYSITLVVGTVNGCYDTVTHNFRVNPSPQVFASNDFNLCLGSSAPLNVSGVNVVQYSWTPLQGLSCYDCPNPIASPVITTPYVIKGTSNLGCSAYDTVVVTVIQPLNMIVSPSDSICIGQSIGLLASGATNYSWSPSLGLSATNISNPVATPVNTTTYRVVGNDGFNCFTDTAFITIGVGQYPTISLGPDLTLATGILHPLVSTVQNGPISIWNWTPSTDLSCDDCPLPVAEIKKDISYIVDATTAYGCSASDTINIKTFCESAQVFIPNAFTPDGDGHNDVLMVRASGVAMVKSFRIFNRWGEVVFERANHPPNAAQYGWDGKVKGVAGGPDVYVYTAEVICENGSSYTYKGNVTILK